MAEEPAEQPPTSAAADQEASEDTSKKQPQVAALRGFAIAGGDSKILTAMPPTLIPGLLTKKQDQELPNRGRGLYAVPVAPMGSYTAFPPQTLIPFTYNVPTAPSSSESGAAGEDHGQVGQQQPHLQQQQPGHQRQVVVRRFQIAVQIDVMLMLKLAAVIFLFNQDGSRQRLALLIFFASVIYLYQTGALAPLVRWLSQGMQRAAAPPPQPLRPAVRAENAAAGRQGNEDAAGADGLARGENENQPINDENRAGNEQLGEAGAVQGGNQWWGIVKEIQMIVFGFITSLLPGFHNID